MSSENDRLVAQHVDAISMLLGVRVAGIVTVRGGVEVELVTTEAHRLTVLRLMAHTDWAYAWKEAEETWHPQPHHSN